MIDYKKASEKVREKFKAAGKLVKFSRPRSSEKTPSEPWKGASEKDVVVEFPAVVLPPSSASALGGSVVSEDLLKRTRYILMVSSLENQDLSYFPFVEIEDEKYQVMRLETLRPKDQVILYYIWAGR